MTARAKAMNDRYSALMLQRNLVRMANQIGRFFSTQGDDESAMKSIAGHLSHYWAPSMRRDLIGWLDEHNGDGLQPLVEASVNTYRVQLLNPISRIPGEEQLEDPPGGGDAG